MRGLNAKGAAERYSRKVIDELTEFVKHDFGAKGLVWFKVEADGKLGGSSAKNFSESLLVQLGQRMGAEPGDLLLFVADAFEVLMFGLVTTAAIARVLVPLAMPSTYRLAVIVSACLWSLAYAIFALRYLPILTRPRVDGKPG